MLISAKAIKNPRTVRTCADCGEAIYGSSLRLYGAAFKEDKPYVVYTHPECTQWPDPKILEAKKAL